MKFIVLESYCLLKWNIGRMRAERKKGKNGGRRGENRRKKWMKGKKMKEKKI